MASTYPDARWKPLGAQTEDRMDRHDIVCVHTMAGYLVSTDNYFRIGNGEGYRGTESHYGIGGKWGPDLGGDLDGSVYQWQDRDYRADANLEGNGRVISIETADNAVRPIQPWTPAQISALIRLIAWECSTDAHQGCPADWRCHQVGIPPVLVPDTQPSRRGLAYHAQGAADHTVGEWWSTTPSKDCPTSVRIAQFRQTVIPGVVATLAGQPIQETFMSYTEAEERELLTRTRHIDAMLSGNLAELLNDEDKVKAALADSNRVLLAALAAIPTNTLSDEEVSRLAAAIAEKTPTLAANDVITALRNRIDAVPTEA